LTFCELDEPGEGKKTQRKQRRRRRFFVHRTVTPLDDPAQRILYPLRCFREGAAGGGNSKSITSNKSTMFIESSGCQTTAVRPLGLRREGYFALKKLGFT